MSEILTEIIAVLQRLQEISQENIAKDRPEVDDSIVSSSFYDTAEDVLLHKYIVEKFKNLGRDFSSFNSLAIVKKIRAIIRESGVLNTNDFSISNINLEDGSHPLSNNSNYQELISSLCMEVQNVICSSSLLSSPYPTPLTFETPSETEDHPKTLFESLLSPSSSGSSPSSPITPHRKIIKLEPKITEQKPKKPQSGYFSFNFDDFGDFEPIHQKVSLLKFYYSVKDSPHAQFYREEETNELILSKNLYDKYLIQDTKYNSEKINKKIYQIAYGDFDKNDPLFLAWEKLIEIDPYDLLDNPIWPEVLDIIRCALCVRDNDVSDEFYLKSETQPPFLQDGAGIYRSLCVAFCCKLLDSFSQNLNDQIFDLYDVILSHLLTQFHIFNSSTSSSSFLSPNHFQTFALEMKAFMEEFTPDNKKQRLSSCPLELKLSLILLKNIIKHFSVISKIGDKNEVFNRVVYKFFTLVYSGKSLQSDFYENFPLAFFIFLIDNDNISKLTNQNSSDFSLVINESFLSNSILYQFLNLFLPLSSVQIFLYSFNTKIVMNMISELLFLPKFYNLYVKKTNIFDGRLNFFSYSYLLFFNFFYFLSSFLENVNSPQILQLLFLNTNENNSKYDFSLKTIENTNKLFYYCPNSTNIDHLIQLLFGFPQELSLSPLSPSHQSLTLEIILECIFSIPLEYIHESFYPTLPQFIQYYLTTINYFSNKLPTLSEIGIEYIIKFIINLTDNDIFLNNFSHFLYSFVHDIIASINKNLLAFNNNNKIPNLLIQLFCKVTEKFQVTVAQLDTERERRKEEKEKVEMLFISLINFSESFKLFSNFNPNTSVEFLKAINYLFTFSAEILMDHSKIKCSFSLLGSILSYLIHYYSFFQQNLIETLDFNKVFKQIAKFTMKKSSSACSLSLSNQIQNFILLYFDNLNSYINISLHSSFFSNYFEKLISDSEIFTHQYDSFDSFSLFMLGFLNKQNELKLISHQFILYFLFNLLGLNEKKMKLFQDSFLSSYFISQQQKLTTYTSLLEDIKKIFPVFFTIIDSLGDSEVLNQFNSRVSLLMEKFKLIFSLCKNELEEKKSIINFFDHLLTIFFHIFPYNLIENIPGSILFYRQVILFHLSSNSSFELNFFLNNNSLVNSSKETSILSFNPYNQFFYNSFFISLDLFKHAEINFFQKYSIYIDSFLPLSSPIKENSTNGIYSNYFSQKKNLLTSTTPFSSFYDNDSFSTLSFPCGGFSNQAYHCLNLARNEKELNIIFKHLGILSEKQADIKLNVLNSVKSLLAGEKLRDDFPLEILTFYLLDKWLTPINILEKNRVDNLHNSLYNRYDSFEGKSFSISKGTPSLLCSAMFLYDNINALKSSSTPLNYSSLSAFISTYLFFFHRSLDFESILLEDLFLQLSSFAVEWNLFQDKLSSIISV